MNDEVATALFEEQRPRLLALAYQMLGEIQAAEDVVQEAWVRWNAADQARLESPGAWLSTVVTRLAIDQLRAARHKREVYVGPWLPEPILSSTGCPDDSLELARNCELAMLWSLERLGEEERAVFILAEVFELRHADIARMLGRSEDSVRQMASRARRRLRSLQPRFEASSEAVAQAMLAFSTAASAGSKEDVLRMLAPNVVALTDGGGLVSAARIPLEGAEQVAQVFTHIAQKRAAQTDFELIEANGRPALAHLQGDERDMLLTLRLDKNGLIEWIYVLRNPEKLAALTGRRRQPAT